MKNRFSPCPPAKSAVALHKTLMAFCFACLLTAGCGGNGDNKPDPSRVPATKPAPAETPEQVHWTYEPGALQLVVYSDENLNSYNGYAHATVLCIYQLKEPSGFQQLATSVVGVEKLLECQSFGPSVVHFEEHFIQPGHNATLPLARAENAKHVGLAAGYFQLKPGDATRLYDIPLHHEETGWLWWSKDQYTPYKLTMHLLLGPNSMQRVGEH